MKRKTTLLVAGAAVAAVAILAIAVWFQPQRTLFDQTTNEQIPDVAVVAAATAEIEDLARTGPSVDNEEGAADRSDDPVEITSGDFVDVAHGGTGRARLLGFGDGSQVVRLEELDLDNGPDLRVILSRAPVDSPAGEYDEGDFVDLGALKGNKGNQNYEVPAGVDASEYASVAIWCRRFNTTFNAAPLR